MNDTICVNFEVTHTEVYKTEAEAKISCSLKKNCQGILIWDDETSDNWYSHCLFPNRLIRKIPNFHRYAGMLQKKTVPGKNHNVKRICSESVQKQVIRYVND